MTRCTWCDGFIIEFAERFYREDDSKALEPYCSENCMMHHEEDVGD